MNYSRIYFLLVLTGLSMPGVQAQKLSLGAEIGATLPLDFPVFKTLGVRGDLRLNMRNGIVSGITALLPSRYAAFDRVIGYNGWNMVQQEVETEVTVSGLMFNAAFKHYFFKTQYNKGFGFYGAGGVGAALINYREEIVSYYDRNMYWEPDDYEDNVYQEFALGLSVNLGFGADVALNPRSVIHAEACVNVPADYLGGVEATAYIPLTLNLRLGYRFAFW